MSGVLGIEPSWGSSLLAGGFGPYETIAYPDLKREPNDAFAAHHRPKGPAAVIDLWSSFRVKIAGGRERDCGGNAHH
jgi:hypothetical protein